jgi:hypothetical protein
MSLRMHVAYQKHAWEHSQSSRDIDITAAWNDGMVLFSETVYVKMSSGILMPCDQDMAMPRPPASPPAPHEPSHDVISIPKCIRDEFRCIMKDLVEWETLDPIMVASRRQEMHRLLTHAIPAIGDRDYHIRPLQEVIWLYDHPADPMPGTMVFSDPHRLVLENIPCPEHAWIHWKQESFQRRSPMPRLFQTLRMHGFIREHYPESQRKSDLIWTVHDTPNGPRILGCLPSMEDPCEEQGWRHVPTGEADSFLHEVMESGGQPQQFTRHMHTLFKRLKNIDDRCASHVMQVSGVFMGHLWIRPDREIDSMRVGDVFDGDDQHIITRIKPVPEYMHDAILETMEQSSSNAARSMSIHHLSQGILEPGEWDHSTRCAFVVMSSGMYVVQYTSSQDEIYRDRRRNTIFSIA